MKFRRKIAAVAAAAVASATVAIGMPLSDAAANTTDCPVAAQNKVRYQPSSPRPVDASVKYAQCLLNKHGANVSVDGKFGPGTLEATKNFQRSKNLAADGVIGPNTWAALTGAQAPGNPSDKVIGFARNAIGTPYVWGANGPDSYDCSGLTRAAYRSAGVELPRVSGDQHHAGTPVSPENRQPGDLMWWPGHVGIYAGNGMVLHASRSKGQVVESPVWGSPEYRRVL